MMILQTRFSVSSQGALRLSMDRVVMLAEAIAALLDVSANSVEISSHDIQESTGFSSWVTSTHAITAKILTHDVASMAERFLSLDSPGDGSGKTVLFEVRPVSNLSAFFKLSGKQFAYLQQAKASAIAISNRNAAGWPLSRARWPLMVMCRCSMMRTAPNLQPLRWRPW